MRLFHVSEESNIEVFKPRIPSREDMDKSKGLVWAINDECLPNFLTPRDCPRVTYHISEKTSREDRLRYFSSKDCNHVVVIENKWFNIMKNTTLYLYEFNPLNFYLQDKVAGYYVSESDETPINKLIVDDLFSELFKRNIEVRLVDNLWNLCDEIQDTTLNWSMCSMGNAKDRGVV
ncbi:DUF6886 family protein [Clostridium hydrogeniformans]|uniref:DUF6886 family protein n=1 Tax=Clostridium hydrogeniformans TaxID=349933 RepID=UPI0004888CFE|nr:DUF6886 family protein [Clostridium hydrogeniformans]